MKSIIVNFDWNSTTHTLEYESKEDIQKNTFILIETSRGLELVKTIIDSVFVKNANKIEEKTMEESIDDMEKEHLSFVRIANEKDIATFQQNKQFAEEIKHKAKDLAKHYNLEMKISGAIITLDRNKCTIFFTAENRVDFRDLVKELANTFKTRIELRQVGSRDETEIMGGFGPCGKVCCCKEFLNDFEHVSIKMAKNQNLSLNPTKISGLCGRLMCCLGYENEHYVETGKLMPRINSQVITPSGKGTVVYNDLLKRIVQVKIGDQNSFEIKSFDLNDIKQINKGN